MNTLPYSTARLTGFRFAAMALLGLALIPRQVVAQDAGKPQGFDAFRRVITRNVFDPERQEVRESRRDSSRSFAPSGMVRSSVTLTGTMVTDSKALAFFGSSRSEYNKVASLQESVGDYKVVNIASHEVTLERGGQTTVLGVGKQLPLAGTEPAPPGTAPADGSAVPGAAGSDAPPALPPSGGTSDKDEILRKMMLRRQQEISR